MSIFLADIDATCAALGYSDGERYQAEPDAIQGLKHLIWILRRDLDNHEYRRHLGRAKVLQTDLVYMLPDYVHDAEYADVLIRLLVILTSPTLLLYRDGPPKDHHGRKVFMELIDILQGYKSAFANEKIWTALFGTLKKSLEIDWALRSEEQSLHIERILVLIRNVLQVPANPDAEGRADNDASLHDQVIWSLHQSGILDLVLFVIASPDEHQFHLHGLEILCLLYREQTAESLADASLQRSITEKQRDEQELLAARRREKARLMAKPPAGRHSRFGGTYVIRNLKSVSDRDIICHQALERVTAIDFDREKTKQKRSFRHIQEEAKVTRRSAFSVRLCLREYCIEVLRSAYNTLVRQVRRVLERNSASTSHDDSYLLWAIRFFMEFNRLSGLQLQLVSESLSVQCFHWVLTRMQHDMDMIVSDKKQARLWAKRLHVALQTFRELLFSMLALQKLQDENAQALFDMLLNNVCYVLEYRETILYLLMNYNEAHSTKAFLRDVVETANIFIKMMEKFCKDSVVVQDKKRNKRRAGKKSKKPQTTMQQTEEELSNKWAQMASTLASILSSELQIPETEQPIPFDATAEKSIDNQREDCMIRIHKMLREEQLEQAVCLLRAAREVWPENDIFGAISAAPEDELLLLREIFLHNIATTEKSAEQAEESDSNDEENIEHEEYENGMVERTFKFEDFAKRLLNPKIVRACTIVLTDWESIPTKSLKAAVTILHRIAVGCCCPAMLFQAKLFRIFQQVFNIARDVHQEELRRLGIYVVRKFVEVAPTNPKIYAELLFYKTIKEANELESGYCDAYESGTKGTWTEAQETELRLLFEENQRNPETDKDVIDWMLENLIDKTRTRRGVLKKLKELGLHFKAPTKKSGVKAMSKNHWPIEEDEELRSLYDQYRIETDCLARILSEFEGRRTKQQIIKRMLQLHMIADKSEILPQKTKRRTKKPKAGGSSNEDDEDHHGYMEEPIFGENAVTQKKPKKKKQKTPKQPSKAPKRKIVRTPLDVGTVRALLAQIDDEKYQGAIDWLKECLEDAAEDTEEAAEEDDGVPLLPLQEVQKEAMEDGDFKKVLVALGLQPPIMGVETYWRIPIYLNAADLKLRAKIVAGEEVEIDVADIEVEENEASDQQSTDDDSDSEESSAAEESEEDYFDSKRHKDQKAASSLMEHKQQKMNMLMFTKSDEETEQREPLHQKRQSKSKKKTKKSKPETETDEEAADADIVNEIHKKLQRKKRKPDLSSEDEESAGSDDMKENRDKKNTTQKTTKPMPPSNADHLFEQLKAKRASKMKQTPAATAATVNAVTATNSEEIDELNFNSEDYRQRLLELGGDTDEETEQDMANIEQENTNATTTKARMRRANIIDSDSDDETAADDGNGAGDDSAAEKISNQASAIVDLAAQSNKTEATAAAKQHGNGTIVDGFGADNDVARIAGKKRSRHDLNESDTEAVNGNEKHEQLLAAGNNGDEDDDDDDEDDDAMFIVRKKPAIDAKSLSDEEPAKRRRIAIIDDDDDDDF